MSSTQSSLSIKKLVFVPAVITLLITVARLIGELAGWSETWFGTTAGGGSSIMGISWLMPIFGLYFGWRLARAGRAPHKLGMPLALCIIAIALSSGAAYGIMELTDLQLPHAILYIGPMFAMFTLLVLAAWPSLFLATFLYGLYARIPVAVVTYLAASQEWDTHHVKLAPEAAEMPLMDAAHWLSFIQIILWIPVTVMLGGLFGCFGGVVGKKT